MVASFSRFQCRIGRRPATALTVAVVAAALAGCGADTPPQDERFAPPPTSSAAHHTTTTSTTTTTTTTTSPVPPPPSVATVTAADLGTTWRPGCPLGPERLR